jgi:hypothetical protein
MPQKQSVIVNVTAMYLFSNVCSINRDPTREEVLNGGILRGPRGGICHAKTIIIFLHWVFFFTQ